jgi:hypothetical protein
MSSLSTYAAGALLCLLVALCLIAAVGVAALVGGILAAPAAAITAVAIFQALRVPVGRTTGRLLDN